MFLKQMEEEKSKSQKKRDAETLQKLGVTLIDWHLDKLEQLSLPDRLKQAIIEAKSLSSHGAMRRQAQLIGKLMRKADLEALYSAYEAILAEENAQTAVFHDIEHWRKRLIHDGREALTEFIDIYHPDDVQQLKQCIKKAIEAETKSPHPGASRALFRYLRGCMQ